MMNAPSSGSCAHQVAARYQPLNRFQFLCYSPEVPTQNRMYRALWSAVRHSTSILCCSSHCASSSLYESLPQQGPPRFRNGTRSVTGSLTDPGGHGHGSLLSGNLFMHCSSNLNFRAFVTYIVSSLEGSIRARREHRAPARNVITVQLSQRTLFLCADEAANSQRPKLHLPYPCTLWLAHLL